MIYKMFMGSESEGEGENEGEDFFNVKVVFK
jgi:hypothetical protein